MSTAPRTGSPQFRSPAGRCDSWPPGGEQKSHNICPPLYHQGMARSSRSERNVVNLVMLRHVRDALEDDELRSDVDQVVDDLRQDAGETLPKAAAARVLGVSRGTLEKWIGRAMIPTRTVDGLERVERAGLEEIAAEVAALRRLREDNPAVLAEALTRLAGRDPEFAGIEAQITKSLNDVEHDELVPLRIPNSFGPED
jgi:hypothetical protein